MRTVTPWRRPPRRPPNRVWRLRGTDLGFRTGPLWQAGPAGEERRDLGAQNRRGEVVSLRVVDAEGSETIRLRPGSMPSA